LNPLKLESIPVVLPHYRREKNQLFFLVSKKSAIDLSFVEATVFDRIDGKISVGELLRSDSNSQAFLSRLHDQGLLVFVQPLNVEPGAPSRVVIEPHMDDAALSLGGYLLQAPNNHRTTIVSVVKWSNYTSYINLGRTDLLNYQRVTQLRIKESELAARLIGARFSAMNESDSPMSAFKESEAPIDLSKVDESAGNLGEFLVRAAAWRAFGFSSSAIARLASEIEKAVLPLAPDELYFPMGIGDHFDHVRTRNACLKMLYSNPEWFKRCRVFMYEDVPYRLEFSGHSEQITKLLETSGAKIVKHEIDISASFGQKLELLLPYSSQWKLSTIAERIRVSPSSASGGNGKGHFESFVEIMNLPNLPRPQELALRNRPELAELKAKLGGWKERRDQIMNLFVISRGPVGRWKQAIETLSKHFPNTKLNIYANEQFKHEARPTDDVQVKTVFLDQGLFHSNGLHPLLQAIATHEAKLILCDPLVSTWPESFEALPRLGFKSEDFVMAEFLGAACSALEQE
jgi:LmbE family N-acetylglucosaminyl deacetylase